MAIEDTRGETLNRTSDVLEIFGIKLDGLSTFHIFAEDNEVIELVHQVYMHRQHEEKFVSKNQKDIALFILSPDDHKSKVAIDIA